MGLEELCDLEVEQGPCGLFHAVLVERELGWRVVSEAHWENEEDARVGGQAIFDQTDASMRQQIEDFTRSIPEAL